MDEIKYTQWGEWTAIVHHIQYRGWTANIYRPIDGNEIESYIKTGYLKGELRETLTSFGAPAQLEWKEGQPNG
jgi:hypothetical protein